MTRFNACTLAFLLLLVHPLVSHAQWKLDGAQVTSAFYHELEHDAVSDGAGGMVLAWRDGNLGQYRIRVQRVNALGVNQWAANGVILTTVSQQGPPKLVADGAGGWIVTWHDQRNGNYDIYAQRVNGAGAPQWTAGGVAVCTDGGSQQLPKIVSAYGGGAVIAWSDNRFFTSDFYAQRINNSGVGQWGTNGVPMFVDFYSQDNLVLAPDPSGGAILAWIDYQFPDDRIIAQQVDYNGTIFHPGGLVVCSAPGNKFDLVITPDGDYGAFVAWSDARSGVASHLYAQRIAGSGFNVWDPDGIPIATAGNTMDLAIASDGAKGAVLSWSDYRNGFDADVYAQRFNAQGLLYWPANGALVCAAPSDQWETSVIPDGAGGAIVSWLDLRAQPFYADIYANRLNSSGQITWAFNGIPLCTAIGNQRRPIVVTDGAGGAIVAWEDFRGPNGDLYSQRIEKRGYWGRPEPFAETASDIPGDQGGKVAVNWLASSQDIYDLQVVSHYSVWRATDVVPAAATLVSSGDEIGPNFQGSAYRRDMDAAGNEYYWELVGNQSAIYSPRYSFSASTRSDSSTAANADHYFQVLAHTWNQFVFWTSNVVSGHSVDNLAPAAPLALIAQRVGRDVQLRWNRAVAPDVRDYSVYRATTSGVTPIAGNFFATSEDTVAVDANAPVSVLYYIVTATDVHDNQSAASNEASVQSLTGIGNLPAITALTVLQNYPNPFAGSTDLSVGLPRESDVSIEIYDVAGRVVRSEHRSRVAAGWQRVSLHDRDGHGKPLASGVYFYRVTAAGSTVTKKMVIAR